MKQTLTATIIPSTQNSIDNRPLVQICMTGDLNTDYRVHKTALSLLTMGFRVECITAQCKAVMLPIPQPYAIRVMKLMFHRGPQFFIEYNLRLFWYLIWHGSHTILSIDLDTLTGCRMANGLRHRRLIYDSHEYFPEVPELQHRPKVKKVWEWLERTMIKGVDKAYTVCGSIANIYKGKYGVHFDVVRNLPQRQRLTDVVPAIVDSRFVIVYQGAVNKGRGIIETIRALPLLDDVLLVIVGSGDEMNDVRHEIATLNVADKVMMIGRIPFAAMMPYTRSAKVGLCLLENIGLNYYFSLPNRIFDFALAGIPVLASNFPEIRKVVGQHGTGVLIDDLQPETIAHAINSMRNDTEGYGQMCENAKKASKTLVWENELPVLERIFKS